MERRTNPQRNLLVFTVIKLVIWQRIAGANRQRQTQDLLPQRHQLEASNATIVKSQDTC